MLLPGEDEAALVELRGRLMEELRPVGKLEGLLVERVIGAVWRLRRLGRVEAGIFAWERFEELAERAEREADKYESHPDASLMEVIDTEITDAEKHKEALSRAQQMRSEQEAETATLGRTFVRDANGANAFSKLSRYETTIERGLYKALHELQRLQAATAGACCPRGRGRRRLRCLRGGRLGRDAQKWVRFAKTRAGSTDRPERPDHLRKALGDNPPPWLRFEMARVLPSKTQTRPPTRGRQKAPYRPVLGDEWHAGRSREWRLTARLPCWGLHRSRASQHEQPGEAGLSARSPRSPAFHQRVRLVLLARGCRRIA
jgi:hypothetical protein